MRMGKAMSSSGSGRETASFNQLFAQSTASTIFDFIDRVLDDYGRNRSVVDVEFDLEIEEVAALMSKKAINPPLNNGHDWERDSFVCKFNNKRLSASATVIKLLQAVTGRKKYPLPARLLKKLKRMSDTADRVYESMDPDLGLGNDTYTGP